MSRKIWVHGFAAQPSPADDGEESDLTYKDGGGVEDDDAACAALEALDCVRIDLSKLDPAIRFLRIYVR